MRSSGTFKVRLPAATVLEHPTQDFPLDATSVNGPDGPSLDLGASVLLLPLPDPRSFPFYDSTRSRLPTPVLVPVPALAPDSATAFLFNLISSPIIGSVLVPVLAPGAYLPAGSTPTSPRPLPLPFYQPLALALMIRHSRCFYICPYSLFRAIILPPTGALFHDIFSLPYSSPKFSFKKDLHIATGLWYHRTSPNILETLGVWSGEFEDDDDRRAFSIRRIGGHHTICPTG